jgi:hypothetical protein
VANFLILTSHFIAASAPLKELQKKLGFETDHAVAAAKELLGKN